MPGFRRWNPSEELFSYAKLCFYYIPCLLVFLGIAALLISAFGRLQWLDQIGSLLPSSVPLRVAIGAALIGAYYVFFTTWRFLPGSCFSTAVAVHGEIPSAAVWSACTAMGRMPIVLISFAI